MIRRIPKEDAHYYRLPSNEQKEVVESTRRATVWIARPDLEKGNKWFFREHTKGFWAPILDEEFMKRIQNREITFGKGDSLDADLRVTTTVSTDGNSERYTLVKVHAHNPGQIQDEMPV